MSVLMGRVAIVTGGSKGIGAAAAKALAADAAAVVVNYSSGKEGAGRVVESAPRAACTETSQIITSSLPSKKSEVIKRGES
jgi:NAD(P)-dependent dehydrogenase (short-subunit alcohol dehydrogenase family)